MKLVLHIGATKTGSSALQAALYRDQASLLESGVAYPERGIVSSAHHLLAAAIHPEAHALHRGALPEDRLLYAIETMRGMIADARSAEARMMLISSEYLWTVLPTWSYARLRAAIHSMPMEVLAVLRRPDDWTVSTYLQAVKRGERRDFPEYCGAMLARPKWGLDVDRIVLRWRNLTEAQGVRILRYEDIRQNVAAAVADELGIRLKRADKVIRSNPSPTPEGLRRLLRVNRGDMSDAGKDIARREILAEHHSFDGVAQDIAGPSERRAIWDKAAPSLARLARILDRPPFYAEAEKAVPATP